MHNAVHVCVACLFYLFAGSASIVGSKKMISLTRKLVLVMKTFLKYSVIHSGTLTTCNFPVIEHMYQEGKIKNLF